MITLENNAKIGVITESLLIFVTMMATVQISNEKTRDMSTILVADQRMFFIGIFYRLMNKSY